jgi:hypothetical protein
MTQAKEIHIIGEQTRNAMVQFIKWEFATVL